MTENTPVSFESTSKKTVRALIAILLVLIIAGSFGGYLFITLIDGPSGLGKVCYDSGSNLNSPGSNSSSSQNYDEQWSAQIGSNVSSDRVQCYRDKPK